jgi:hypothetical protein
VWHVQVEEDEVGIQFEAPLDGHAGIGDGVHPVETRGTDHPFQQDDVRRVVIDDQHLCVGVASQHDDSRPHRCT